MIHPPKQEKKFEAGEITVTKKEPKKCINTKNAYISPRNRYKDEGDSASEFPEEDSHSDMREMIIGIEDTDRMSEYEKGSKSQLVEEKEVEILPIINLPECKSPNHFDQDWSYGRRSVSEGAAELMGDNYFRRYSGVNQIDDIYRLPENRSPEISPTNQCHSPPNMLSARSPNKSCNSSMDSKIKASISNKNNPDKHTNIRIFPGRTPAHAFLNRSHGPLYPEQRAKRKKRRKVRINPDVEIIPDSFDYCTESEPGDLYSGEVVPKVKVEYIMAKGYKGRGRDLPNVKQVNVNINFLPQ